jgi:hypothetical protein
LGASSNLNLAARTIGSQIPFHRCSGGNSMTIQLGQLNRIDPRNIWPNEATKFTPSLAENLHQHAEVPGMDLELIRLEARHGAREYHYQPA